MTPNIFQLDEFYEDLIQHGSRISNLSREEISKKPFPGLRPFKTSEFQIFKGRDGQAEELIKRLNENFFLSVIGSSGTGKSSLVRAGLIPQLLGGYLYEAGTKWKIAICRPGKNPIQNLAVALAAAKCNSTNPTLIKEDFEKIEPILKNSIYGLLEINDLLNAENVESKNGDNGNLLIIVDQFEELFRFGRKDLNIPNIEDHFVNLLLKAALNQHSSVYVVITMRSEFLGDCIKYRGLPEAINMGQYLVPQLSRFQLRQVITDPIRLSGNTISEGLVELLVNEIEEGKIKENADQLPVLQHTLMRTYQAAKKNTEESVEINYDHYQEIGGMQKSLAKHAERKYLELGKSDRSTSGKQLLAKVIFQSITDLSNDQKGGRKPTELQNIYDIAKAIGATQKHVDEVINHFRDPDTSFIMPPINTPLAPDLIIDISHESLMRNWDRLNRWIIEDAQHIRLYKILDERRLLKEQGKDEWLRGGLLQEILLWRDRYPTNSAWARKINKSAEQDYNLNLKFLSNSRRNKNSRRWKLLGAMAFGVLGLLISIIYYIDYRANMAALPSARREILALTNEEFYRAPFFSQTSRDSLIRDSLIGVLIKTKYEDEDETEAVHLLTGLNQLASVWDVAAINPMAGLIKTQNQSYLSYPDLQKFFLRIHNKHWLNVGRLDLGEDYTWPVVSLNKKFIGILKPDTILVHQLKNNRFEIINRIPTKELDISLITVFDNGHVIAVSHKYLYEWNRQGERIMNRVFNLNPEQIYAISPYGNYMLILDGQTVRMHSVRNSRINRAIMQHSGYSLGTSFSEDESQILLIESPLSGGTVVSYYQLATNELITLPTDITYATFAPGKRFIIVRQKDQLRLINKNGVLVEDFKPVPISIRQQIYKIELSADWKQLLIQTEAGSSVYENRNGMQTDSIFSRLGDPARVRLVKRQIAGLEILNEVHLLDSNALLAYQPSQLQLLINPPPFQNLQEAFSFIPNVQPLTLIERLDFKLVSLDSLENLNDLITAAEYEFQQYTYYDSLADSRHLANSLELYKRAIQKSVRREQIVNLAEIAESIISYQFELDSSYQMQAQRYEALVNVIEFELNKVATYDAEAKRALSDAYGNLSRYLLRARNFEASIVAAQKGLKYPSFNNWINSFLATSLWMKGDKQAAFEIYASFKGKKFQNGVPAINHFLMVLDDLKLIGVLEENNPEYIELIQFITSK